MDGRVTVVPSTVIDREGLADAKVFCAEMAVPLMPPISAMFSWKLPSAKNWRLPVESSTSAAADVETPAEAEPAAAVADALVMTACSSVASF